MPLEVMPHYGDGPGAGRGHEGQDLFAPAGTAEVAIVDAIVLEAGSGYQGGRGNYVSIYSAETDRTYNYFHMLGSPRSRPASGPRRAGARRARLHRLLLGAAPALRGAPGQRRVRADPGPATLELLELASTAPSDAFSARFVPKRIRLRCEQAPKPPVPCRAALARRFSGGRRVS